MIEPDVTGSEGIPQVKQDRHLPKVIAAAIKGWATDAALSFRHRDMRGA